MEQSIEFSGVSAWGYCRFCCLHYDYSEYPSCCKKCGDKIIAANTLKLAYGQLARTCGHSALVECECCGKAYSPDSNFRYRRCCDKCGDRIKAITTPSKLAYGQLACTCGHSAPVVCEGCGKVYSPDSNFRYAYTCDHCGDMVL